MRTLKPQPARVSGVASGRSSLISFSEKFPQARKLDDVVRRQGRADHFGPRRGVNFIEMTLCFALLHKLLDTFV